MKPFDASIPCYCSSTEDAFSKCSLCRHGCLSRVLHLRPHSAARGTYSPQYCLTFTRHMPSRTQL